VEDPKVAEQLEIQAKYAGYIDRQKGEIERQRANESVKLPDNFEYDKVRGLSSEVREKLIKSRPATIGQAGRIPGMTPAAISLLLIHLKRKSA
jgi:tRNA uridine 5-carboxymethylaminomethyl modification enzyme